MKKTLTVNLDYEIVEKLKQEKNYSSLINKILNDHYSMTALNAKADKLTKEQLEEMLKIAEKKEELKRQYEEAEKELNDRFKMD